jgi:UDPglucose 6-dehydrogenase
MVALARQHGLELQLLPQVDVVNEQQKERFFEKLVHALDGTVAGKTVGIWGLAFKPETDDIREAPSLLVINRLLENGATVQAFDPQAMDHMRAVVGDRVRFARSPYDALRGADVLGIVTEWSEFEQPDFERMRAEMSRHIIVDGRNMFDPQRMAAQGFVYVSIGRATARPHSSAADRQPSNLAATSPSN